MPKPPILRKSAIFVLRRKTLAVIAAAAAVIVIFALVTSPAVVGASAASRELPVYSVRRDNRAVSLTFDAAGDDGDTRQLIDVLARYDVKATFFVTGDWADRYPESVRALAQAGHEVMNNSDGRAHLLKLSAPEIVKDVTACSKKIAAITGAAPALFRAPYGEYDDNVIRTVASMGMTTVQWDVDSLDWKGLSASGIESRVTGGVRPGSIVLFHVGAAGTPQALPAIIGYLVQNGYSIVPVSQLLLAGDCTVDRAGRQIPA